MFGKWFGRKKAVLEEIILPQSCFEDGADPWAKTSAVVDYVNQMRETALFVDGEIPRVAVQLYYADYYYAQICNGGHSQFVHNARDPIRLLKAANEAFLAMKGNAFSHTIQTLITWIKANPEEAANQDGFEHRHPDLDALDEAFFAANVDDAYFTMADDYITALPNLKRVAPSAYQFEIEKVCALNPRYQDRKLLAEINKINWTARDPLRAGIQMAASSASMEMEVLSINGGRPIQLDGEETILWGVSTNQGQFWGCLYSEGSFIAPNNDGNPGLPIGRVSQAVLSQSATHTERYEVGAIVWHLAQKAQIDGVISFAVFLTRTDGGQTQDDGGIYLVKIDDCFYRMVITCKNSLLVPMDNAQPLAIVNSAEAKSWFQALSKSAAMH